VTEEEARYVLRRLAILYGHFDHGLHLLPVGILVTAPATDSALPHVYVRGIGDVPHTIELAEALYTLRHTMYWSEK